MKKKLTTTKKRKQPSRPLNRKLKLVSPEENNPIIGEAVKPKPRGHMELINSKLIRGFDSMDYEEKVHACGRLVGFTFKDISNVKLIKHGANDYKYLLIIN